MVHKRNRSCGGARPVAGLCRCGLAACTLRSLRFIVSEAAHWRCAQMSRSSARRRPRSASRLWRRHLTLQPRRQRQLLLLQPRRSPLHR